MFFIDFLCKSNLNVTTLRKPIERKTMALQAFMLRKQR